MTTRSVQAQAWAALTRPVAILPEAASMVARRLVTADPRGHAGRPNLMARLSRWVGLTPNNEARASSPEESDADLVRDLPTGPLAWSPHWMAAGEPLADGAVTLTPEGVAVFAIEGPLVEQGGWWCGEYAWGYRDIAAVLDLLDADPRVRGVFVRLHSPGGVVSPALDDLAAQLAARRARTGHAPLWIHAPLGASAAYWLAAHADRVIAPAGGTLGSIGVVFVHVDQSAMLADAGIVVTPITFGAAKVDGASWAPLGEAAQARLQAEIDDIGARFVASVSRGRGLRPSAVRAQEAMVFHAGASAPARCALVQGLCDDVLSERDAYAALLASLSAPPVTAPVAAAAALSVATKPEIPMTDPSARARAFLATQHASAMSPEEQLDAIREILSTEDDPEAEGEDDAPEDGAEDAPDDAPEDDVEAADDEVEPAARAALSRAQAILDLPEARGREAMARRLAFAGTFTLRQARAALEAAPRTARLAERMAGLDAGVTAAPGARKAAAAPLADNAPPEAVADFILSARKAARGA